MCPWQGITPVHLIDRLLPRVCERLIARSRPSTSSAAVQIRGSDPDNGGDETGRSPPPARQAAGAHTTLPRAAAALRRVVCAPAAWRGGGGDLPVSSPPFSGSLPRI